MINLDNILLIVGAYLIGSIPTAVWVGKAFYDKDVLHYECFFIPNTAPGMYYRNLMNNGQADEVHGLMAEESEFDLIFYLMMGKVDLEELDIFRVPGDLVL